jgi:hypothetical protein
MKIFAKISIALIPVLLLSEGCTNLSSFPNAARAGDTVVLGMGSQDRVTKGNTQVFYTSDTAPSTPIPISNTNIRAYIQLYGDKTSQAFSPNLATAADNFKFLHHETWETVAVIDLPLGLPVDTGKVTFVTTLPQLTPLEPTILSNYPDLNTVDVALEITGTGGTPNPFDYATTSGGALTGNLDRLRPQRQALIKPPVEDAGSLWTTTFGAVELVVDLSNATDSTGTLTENSLRIVAQDVSMFTKSKAQMTWSLNNTDLKVIYISTTGNLQYYEPRFSIVGETADFPIPPTVTSVAYYDVNGVSTTGPAKTDYAVSVFGLLP